MKFIKKFIGEIILMSGVGLFVFNVFNFSYWGGTGGEQVGIGALPKLGGYEFEYVRYYYSQNTLIMLTIGATLITFGILIIRNKKRSSC